MAKRTDAQKTEIDSVPEFWMLSPVWCSGDVIEGEPYW
jgi:hypothetical protein